jgi:YegS/Rv2252/BmrU family lipid kinase
MASAVRARFLVNPFSGVPIVRPPIYQLIEKTFLKSDWDFDIKILRARGDGMREATRAAEEGLDLVVGVGGDGTLHDIGNGLIGSTTALGIVPLGSGNGYARALGIPLDVSRAVQALLTGTPAALDVGEVDGNYFLSTSGVGLDATVGQEFEKSPIRGGIPYFGIAFREILQYRPFSVKVECGGESHAFTALLVTVANTNQFGLGAVIAPKARPDDGLLDVCVIEEFSVLEALIHTPKLFLGEIDQLPNVRIFQTPVVRVILEREVPGHLDGEPHALPSDPTFRVRPGSLNVWLPAPAAAQ